MSKNSLHVDKSSVIAVGTQMWWCGSEKTPEVDLVSREQKGLSQGDRLAYEFQFPNRLQGNSS